MLIGKEEKRKSVEKSVTINDTITTTPAAAHQQTNKRAKKKNGQTISKTFWIP